jgi:UDP-N-acetylglucosamine diphosphorylase/glucosamine-1-phosphate N-acetyltransferase
MPVYVFEDDGIANLSPLILTRPAFDLRCGAVTLLERQLRALGVSTAVALVRPELAELCQLNHPDLRVNQPASVPGESVVLVNARWLLPASFTLEGGGPEVGLSGEQVAYVRPPIAEARDLSVRSLGGRLTEWQRALPNRRAGGCLIDYPWDLIERNASALEQDWADWQRRRERRQPRGITVLGPAERCFIEPSARVDPLVLIDTTPGPVLIDRGAVVQSFSRIVGPCYVGPETQILGARVTGGSFGPTCKIGGELEECIIQGYSNKAHEGFLGHSYLGEWVNLGSGTQVSDLRNDYGMISLTLGSRKVDSGRIKVGAFIGDHTKTSIGALVNTGSVVGAFGQLLAFGGLLPRVVPSFCQFGHGQLRERTDLRALFSTAATVMGRRGREWTDRHAEFFFELYEQTATERQQLIHEREQLSRCRGVWPVAPPDAHWPVQGQVRGGTTRR